MIFDLFSLTYDAFENMSFPVRQRYPSVAHSQRSNTPFGHN